MTPRGVQLWLGTESEPHARDTLVMSNLGYFQLKAQPGAWNLSLAPGAQGPDPLNDVLLGSLLRKAATMQPMLFVYHAAYRFLMLA